MTDVMVVLTACHGYGGGAVIAVDPKQKRKRIKRRYALLSTQTQAMVVCITLLIIFFMYCSLDWAND